MKKSLLIKSMASVAEAQSKMTKAEDMTTPTKGAASADLLPCPFCGDEEVDMHQPASLCYAHYRSIWQRLQVAERNKMQWRAYALALRGAAPVEQGQGAWHDAVLAECMKVESCYKADDPAGTIRALINWYYEEASSVSDGVKRLADNYMRLTCGEQAQGAGVVPEGAKLVPLKMDANMWRAWQGISNALSTKEMDAIYSAVLAAAPALPGAAADQVSEPSRVVMGFWIEDGRIEFANDKDFDSLKDGTYHVCTAPVLRNTSSSRESEGGA